MSEILALLRKQTNGAVTDSMEDRGVVWPLNYGVSVPAIRTVASQYATDYSLGKLLYLQQVRELRLAGVMVADPLAVSMDELSFWADGVINTEVAEHLSFLLARSNALPDVVSNWLTADNVLLRYALLLSATRRIISDRSEAGLDVDLILQSYKSLLSVDSRPLWRSFAAFLNALYKVSEAHRQLIDDFSIKFSESEETAANYIAEELYLESSDGSLK